MRFHTRRQSSIARVVGGALAVSMASSFVAPLVAAAQDPAAPIVSRAQTKDPVEQWKQEMADAKLRRTKARHMEVGGFLLAFGSYVLSFAIIENCHGCAAAPIVAIGGVSSGIALGYVGKTRVTDANVEIGALLARGPKTMPSVAVPLGKDSPFVVTVGQTTGVTYRVRW
jgi:hypothetical protein